MGQYYPSRQKGRKHLLPLLPALPGGQLTAKQPAKQQGWSCLQRSPPEHPALLLTPADLQVTQIQHWHVGGVIA